MSLELSNRTHCYYREIPKIFQPCISYDNLQNIPQRIEIYSKLRNVESKGTSDYASINLQEKSFKQFNNETWTNHKIYDLIENLKKLNDEEVTYIIYETLGEDYLEKKDYEASTYWLHQGIKKGEPNCLKLIEKSMKFPPKSDLLSLREDLKLAVEKRIQKLNQSDKLSKDSLVTIKRLQQWIIDEEARKTYESMVFKIGAVFFHIALLTLTPVLQKYNRN